MPKNQKPTVETVETLGAESVRELAPVVSITDNPTTVEPKSCLVLRVSEAGYASDFIPMLRRAVNSRGEYQFGRERFTAQSVTDAYQKFVSKLAREWNRPIKNGETVAPLASNYDALYSIYGKGTSAIDIRVNEEDALRFAKQLARIIGFDNYVNLEMAYDAIHLLSEDIATRPNNDKFGLDDLKTEPATALNQILSAVA